jgi:hypothetical protein
MFAVRRVILEELLADPEWSSKLENAKTGDEAIKVLKNFCKRKRYKVEHVK